MPGDARFLRIVFLTRVSNADHDMAVLATKTQSELDEWTPKLQADPEGSCRTLRGCSWVPGGIAVTAEKRTAENKWKPAH